MEVESENITDRQMEIITAAGRILSRSGVNGLTIKKLAAEMKFTEGAVYRHFISKDQIILFMLDYLMRNIRTRLQPLAQGKGNALEKYDALFNSQMEFFKAHPHFVVAVFPDGLLEETGEVNDAITKIVGTKTLFVRIVLTQGQEEGHFTKTLTTDQLTHITMGTFRMLMFKWRISNFGFDLKTEGNLIMNALLKIISA